jgi:inorganic pyrophosphatase
MPLPLNALRPFTDDGELLQVVVETPRGCRNKYHYDERNGFFCLKKVLPAGMGFPFDFGFVPGTLGADGDPLDALVLMDEGSFPGCVVTCRLLGIIEMEQGVDGRAERNDRILAVADVAPTYKTWKAIEDVDGDLLDELERFLVAYVDPCEKTVRVIARRGAKQARAAIDAARTVGENE